MTAIAFGFCLLSTFIAYVDSWESMVAVESFSRTTTTTATQITWNESSEFDAFDIFMITMNIVLIVLILLIVVPVGLCCYRFRAHKPWLLCFNFVMGRYSQPNSNCGGGTVQSAMNANLDRTDCQAYGNDSGLELQEVVVHATSSSTFVE